MLTMGLAHDADRRAAVLRSAGVFAPWALAALRFVQGIGLGGEWGGAALIAVENAPEVQRAWYGMFPQLGPPISFLVATGLFLLLLLGFGEAAFVDWAWRVPFLLSAVLVAIGTLCARLARGDPGVQSHRARSAGSRAVDGDLPRSLAGADPRVARDRGLLCALLYFDRLRAGLWRQSAWNFARALSRIAVRGGRLEVLATPLSAALADRFGRRPVPLVSALIAIAVGLAMPALLSAGTAGVFAFLALALGAMGLTFAPLGALLPELFPVPVRYTGASSTYNLGGTPGRLLRAVARADFPGARRRRLGRLLHRRGWRDQLPGCVQHARDAGSTGRKRGGRLASMTSFRPVRKRLLRLEP